MRHDLRWDTLVFGWSKQRPLGQSVRRNTLRERAEVLWVPQSRQETQRDIHPFERYTVRAWESEKEKSWHFSLFKLHTQGRKIDWVFLEFLSTTTKKSWSIQKKIWLLILWWDCIYSWDLFVVYLVYCGLKFSTNSRVVISIL